MIYPRPTPWRREKYEIVDAIGQGVMSFAEDVAVACNSADDYIALLDRIVRAVNNEARYTVASTPREINL